MGVFRVARFLCHCLVWFFSFSILTAEASRVKPVARPSSAQDSFVKSQGTSGQTTLDIDRHWGEVIDIPASGYSSSARVNLPVTHKSAYSPARIGGMIKNLLKVNPAAIAGTAGLVYLIDQLPGASFDPVTGQPRMMPQFTPSGEFWKHSNPNVTEKQSSSSAFCNRWNPPDSTGWQYTRSMTMLNSGAGVRCFRTYSSMYCPTCQPNQVVAEGWRTQLTCTHGFNSTTLACNTTALVPIAMTDAQLDSLIANTVGMSASAWEDTGSELLSHVPASFDGPDEVHFWGPETMDGTPTITTTTNPSTGTTTVTESTPIHDFEYSTNPDTITTTTTVTNNTYENGVLTETTNITQGAPSPDVSTSEDLKIPTDCEFMPTVCAFIDWFKEPLDEPEPDLSSLISDEDYSRDFSISSNAVCPAPASISTGLGVFEFSYQPACTWAGMIKPFILIAALISAIFINLGAIRSSD